MVFCVCHLSRGSVERSLEVFSCHSMCLGRCNHLMNVCIRAVFDHGILLSWFLSLIILTINSVDLVAHQHDSIRIQAVDLCIQPRCHSPCPPPLCHPVCLSGLMSAFYSLPLWVSDDIFWVSASGGRVKSWSPFFHQSVCHLNINVCVYIHPDY